MIHIDKLNYHVGSFALRDVSLHVETGEYFVLLGPSGSGKTLLLESICGLNRIDSGRILVDGDDVTRLEPRRRGVGYLPQDYALFPHRTVRQNAGFGMRYLNEPAARKEQHVDQLLEMLGLTELTHRRPANLSGGEKQRAALARALAVRPRLLLLDEPVSALDEETRDELCSQLKQLQRRTGTTTVHVCHNFTEMLAVGDRVAVIEGGRIQQSGLPREVLERPRTRRIARFVQARNILSASARPEGEWLRLCCAGGVELRAVRSAVERPGERVSFLVRPENIRLLTSPVSGAPADAAKLSGVVGSLVDRGPIVQLTVTCPGALDLVVSLSRKEYNAQPSSAGDRVQLAILPEDVHLLED